jgi:hypothetical protein
LISRACDKVYLIHLTLLVRDKGSFLSRNLAKKASRDSLLRQPVDDSLNKLLGGRRATEVAGAYLIFVQRPIDPLAHPIRKVAPVNVIEHHRGREQKRDRIGYPLTRKIRGRAMHRLENRGIDADVGGGSHAQPTHKACHFVRQNIAEKVGSEDHIELPRIQHELHGTGINDALFQLYPAIVTFPNF